MTKCYLCDEEITADQMILYIRINQVGQLTAHNECQEEAEAEARMEAAASSAEHSAEGTIPEAD